MGRRHRFYVVPGGFDGNDVTLSEAESHHASKVLRVRVGEEHELFDGEGRCARGTIERMGREGVMLSILERFTPAVPKGKLTLIQGWLNHEKATHEIIHRGTELGVDEFCYFRAAHSERAPKGEEKWERLALESCKQSGRSVMPTFRVAKDLDEALMTSSGVVAICALRDGATSLVDAVAGEEDVRLLVGPEGGLSAEEVSRAIELGAKAVSLGSNTLRSEVAAMTACVLAQQAMGRFA